MAEVVVRGAVRGVVGVALALVLGLVVVLLIASLRGLALWLVGLVLCVSVASAWAGDQSRITLTLLRRRDL